MNSLLKLQISFALLAAAVGLIVRGRVLLCMSFFVYLVATLIVIAVELVWSDLFLDYSAYSMKETGLVVIKMMVALEIWWRSFSSFPRARVRVGLLLLLALVPITVGVVLIPAGMYPYDVLVGIVHARQQAGTLALYSIVAAAAFWHRVPPLHRAVLAGFALYLTVLTLASSYLGAKASFTAWKTANLAQLVTYAIAVVWWARVAWRPAQAPDAIRLKLHPWARSW